MYAEPYELRRTPQGMVARVNVRGSAVLASPTINRGTAFTDEQRQMLGLTGLLPTGVSTIDGQVARTYGQFSAQNSALAKWVYLANLRDRNEVLFYRLLSEHIAEMLPIVYTPTVGLAIERFSHEFRCPRGGVYLSVDHPDDVETALRNTGMGPEDVDLLVATDSEGILGIGDQGVGGIEIAIGKLAVYTAAAGIHPHRVVPVVLDMGTDNLGLLNDDMYLGVRHARIQDERYDRLIDAYVAAATKLFPHAMLHWEDFGASNARRVLNRYADEVCTFNDDMQGTAAVVLAAALSASRAAGRRMRDQRIVIHGAGTAGLGIADMIRDVMVSDGLTHAEATERFYALGSRGLLVDDSPRLRDFQVPYARPATQVAQWPGAERERHLGRRRATGSADDAHRHLHPSRSVHRGDRAADGDAHRTTHHHAAVQPHIQVRGAAPGPDPMDRRPGTHRDRQPIRTRPPRRPRLHHRPGQQRARVSRPRARCHRVAGTPHHRRNDRGGRRRGSAPLRRNNTRLGPPATR
jgi:malate dehydrogenase (oxaloacetate-decarboxylating)